MQFLSQILTILLETRNSAVRAMQGGHAFITIPNQVLPPGFMITVARGNGIVQAALISCTNNEPRDLFEYWLAQQGKLDICTPKLPRGQYWIEAAQEFLICNGFEIPKLPCV